MQRGMAAESIYKERCIAVDDGGSWAKYMSISGSPDDEYDIISEECLLTVDENREGQAAAFGDDIATGCLATEFKREIFVVRRHWSLRSFLFSLFFAYAHLLGILILSSQIFSYPIKLMKLNYEEERDP
ncbi:uncharacterized protein LOC132253552 [Vitis vinifera]|nr:uncharacterized protein LOC132253552 [Vitis vinifera]